MLGGVDGTAAAATERLWSGSSSKGSRQRESTLSDAAGVRRLRLIEKLWVATVGAVRKALGVTWKDAVEIGLIAFARALDAVAPVVLHLKENGVGKDLGRLQEQEPSIVRDYFSSRLPARNLGDSNGGFCSGLRASRRPARRQYRSASPDLVKRSASTSISVSRYMRRDHCVRFHSANLEKVYMYTRAGAPHPSCMPLLPRYS